MDLVPLACDADVYYAVMLIKRSLQTVQTRIRLLSKEQSHPMGASLFAITPALFKKPYSMVGSSLRVFKSDKIKINGVGNLNTLTGTVITLSFLTDRSGQTVQTQIRRGAV